MAELDTGSHHSHIQKVRRQWRRKHQQSGSLAPSNIHDEYVENMDRRQGHRYRVERIQ